MEIYLIIGFTNNMLKTLIAFNQGDIFEEVAHQELWDPDEKYCLFNVSNLWECPEDAIIGRSLHDADDASLLIKYGMKYSKEGYDDVIVIHIECPDKEDLEEFIENYLNEWKPVQKDQEKE